MPKPQAPETELADLPAEELAQTEMTTAEKIDEILASVRQLNDTVAKLKTFLEAPAKKPSAIDQLVAAIEQLTKETLTQGETLGVIADALKELAPVADEAGGSTPPPSPPRP